MNVIEIIKDFVKTKKDILVEGQSKYLNEWIAEYKGFNPEFHQYKIYKNDGTWDTKIKKSLKAAKMVASDWANLIANEKVKFSVKEKDQEQFDDLLESLNFKMNLNKYYELAMALSISASIITIQNLPVTDDGKISKREGQVKINFLKANQIYPITIEDQVITECAFACDNTSHVNIIIYLKDAAGIYTVYTLKCNKNSSGVIQGIDETTEFNTLSKHRWFNCYYPAIANNIDIESDLPISIFANSIDTLHSIDNKYDGFDQEFSLGKRKIFVRSEYSKTIEVSKDDGTTEMAYVPIFDTNDTVFYTIPNERGENTSGTGITSSAEPLRSQDYIAGINQELSYLSKQCGFGTNRYVFESGGRPIQTATGVISQNSELYQNLKKHEKVLRNELIKFALALMEACNNFTQFAFSTDYLPSDINILFDDSIIEDTDAEQKRGRDNVNAGLLSEEDWVVKFLGKNKEDAEKYVLDNLRWKKLNNYLSAFQTGAISIKLFMKYCYPDIQEGTEEYNELFAFLESNKKAMESQENYNSLFDER